ncbi:NAD-dependent epimerase/dehydratase family protein [Candidatus Desantisbacteria bacterium]|nr:NAD-dependent epimerase/dehydratase family protein [Candidatus Desantisbacteria bacterium]
MEKILVTGGAGFIGSHLVKALIASFDNQVRILIMENESTRLLEGLRVEFITGNLNNIDLLKNALTGIDVVYHCAAYTRSKPLSKLLEVNAWGSQNLFQAALEKGIKKIIYLSSVEVINGNKGAVLTEELPYAAENDYGTSKIEAERIALQYRKKGLKIAILRPCMVYGPGEPHFFNFVLRLLRWRLMFIIGRGNGFFPLVYVDDLVDAMMLAEKKEIAFNSVYTIAGGEIPTVGEFFNLVARMLGVRKPWYIPGYLVYLPALLCEWITILGIAHLPFTRAKLNSFERKRIYDISKARQELGYCPQIGITEGIRRIVKHV